MADDKPTPVVAASGVDLEIRKFEQQAADAKFEREMRRFREIVTAVMAGIILILYPIGIGVLAPAYAAKGSEFAALKDLLLFVNPLLGFVVGYYFNKATSETRAENAESTAKTASASAQQAVIAREQAIDEAGAALERVDEAREYVDEMGRALDNMEEPETTRTLRGDETSLAVSPGRAEMKRLLEKARRALD